MEERRGASGYTVFMEAKLTVDDRAPTWLAENREAIKAYNEHVAQHGVFSAGLRGF